MSHTDDMLAEEKKLTAAPDAKLCEAPGCGATQALFTTNGLNHCFAHRDWPNSKEGKKLLAVRAIDKEGK